SRSGRKSANGFRAVREGCRSWGGGIGHANRGVCSCKDSARVRGRRRRREGWAWGRPGERRAGFGGYGPWWQACRAVPVPTAYAGIPLPSRPGKKRPSAAAAGKVGGKRRKGSLSLPKNKNRNNTQNDLENENENNSKTNCSEDAGPENSVSPEKNVGPGGFGDAGTVFTETIPGVVPGAVLGTVPGSGGGGYGPCSSNNEDATAAAALLETSTSEEEA
ncbi:unnamed protein product, partial [Laminaria digitata]